MTTEHGRATSQSNEAAVRRFYAAFARTDYAQHVRACLADGAVWHISGSHPLAGDVVGADAIVSRMLQFGEASNNTLRLGTTIVSTPTHTVAIHEATHH